jgi:putative component of membrane protein insertase Oxa1/YidC/SpoIIIJ protein YidD
VKTMRKYIATTDMMRVLLCDALAKHGLDGLGKKRKQS